MNFHKNFNIKKIVIYLLAIMLISYGVGAMLLFHTFKNPIKGTNATYNLDDTKTSSLVDINEIDVEISSGTINVIQEGSTEIKAHLYGDVVSNSSYTKPELQCYKSGNTLVIKEVTKTHMTFGFFSSNIKFDVYLPADFNKGIKLATSSGDININGYNFNNLKCNLSSGSLKLKDITTDTFIYTNSSGDLKADKLTTKTTTLNSSSGSINIAMFSGVLSSKNSSGDTKIQYETFDNNIDVHSSSGQIEIKLPKAAEFLLDAATSSGDITCDFPITVSGKKNDHKLKGVVVSDKNKINLDVSSGDIKVLNN